MAGEQQWNAAAQGYLATAAAPANLRNAVLAALTTQEQKAISPRPRRSRRAAMLATALSLAALGSLAALRRPTPHGVLPGLPPAYGEVVKSMGQIRTAQWTRTYVDVDARTGKAMPRGTNYFSVRMSPPAIRVDYADSEPGIVCSPRDNAEILRREILDYLLPARMMRIGQAQDWHLRTVQQGGKTLWRYEIKFFSDSARRLHAIKEQPAIEKDYGFNNLSLTHNGYRLTLWVAPDTRRIVRTENEIYDGQVNNLTISNNFLYDKFLPDSLFHPVAGPATNRK